MTRRRAINSKGISPRVAIKPVEGNLLRSRKNAVVGRVVGLKTASGQKIADRTARRGKSSCKALVRLGERGIDNDGCVGVQ